MKPILLAALSTITVLNLATSSLANEVAVGSRRATRNLVSINPTNLVNSAYQGRFTSAGIPSNARFRNAARLGQIEAKTLVEAAIASGRLAPETLNDRTYLRNVQSYLNNLDNQ